MARTTPHKEGKATVKIVYYTHKTLKDGSHPFLVRITKNRKNRWVSTGFSLHPKYWNPERQEVRKSYPEPYREELLQSLRRWEEKYAQAAKELTEADEVHTAREVATKAIEGRKAARRFRLLEYVDQLVSLMRGAGQVGNATNYRCIANQLRSFIEKEYGATDVPFDKVTVSFCNLWENALRGRGVSEVTISFYFRTLRAVLNRAIAEGVASADKYPFARSVAERHKFSVGKFDTSTTKRAISRDDVRKIEALTPETDRHQLARAAFLFSFYCGGINFVDLAGLRWHNITTDGEGKKRLSYVRQKTGGRFSLRLLPPAEAIVEQFRSFTHNGPDSYVFPIFNPAVHKTPMQKKNRLNKVIGQVNKDLKTLGEQAEIATPLTTYVARHSFATGLKRSGVATAIISEAMGHKTEAVTAVYLDSFASETVDSAFENLL